MTLAHDRDAPPTVRIPNLAGNAAGPPGTSGTNTAAKQRLAAFERKPVEFWPTAAIRTAVETGDITVWQQIVVALRRDPFGRTARQVEEVLDSTSAGGVTKALAEVLARTRAALEAEERAEVAREVRTLITRSGLNTREFASRIGVSVDQLTTYHNGEVSPTAALMVRMHKLSDRFAKIRAQRSTRPATGPQRTGR